MSPAISVVIPTFNRGRVLGTALESVLAQRYREFEVLVIDDGSTDATGTLVSSASGADDRVRYHYQPNRGAASARNAGLELATGRYVAFLDSDDSWQPWHLELAVASLERLPQAGLVWTDIDAVDESGRVVGTRYLPRLLSAYRYFSKEQLFTSSTALSELGVDLPLDDLDRRLYVGDLFSPMVMGNLVMPSSVLIRRDLVLRLGRFDEHLATGEDYEFFLRACRAGPVAFADIADVRYSIATHGRLSGPGTGLAMARAYLEVLDRTLAEDAERITLPAGMIAEARGYAHRWVGEAELEAGSTRAARGQLAQAFRFGRRRARILALLALAFMPRAAVRRMIRWWRGVRERLPT